MKKWLKRISVALLLLQLPLLAGALYLFWNRNELKEQAMQSLKQNTGALITVQNLNINLFSNYPYLTLRLDSIVLSDSNLATHQTPVLSLKTMEMKASWLALLSGTIRVEQIQLSNGSIRLERYSDSTSNFLFFNRLLASKKQTEPSATSNKIELRMKRLIWENIHVLFADNPKEKKISIQMKHITNVFEDKDSIIRFDMVGRLHVDMLGFNLAKGAFLENTALQPRFNLQWNARKQQLTWDGSGFDANGHPFWVDGHLLAQKPAYLLLKIKTSQVAEQHVLSMLPAALSKKIERYQVFGLLDADATIQGSLSGGVDPRVRVAFSGKNQKFTAHALGLDFMLKSFRGVYTNQADTLQPAGDANSVLRLALVDGRWQQYPFLVSGTLTDFEKPMVKARILMPLAQPQMAAVFASLPFKPEQAKGWLKADYVGPALALDLKQNFGIRHWNGSVYCEIPLGHWEKSDIAFRNVKLNCNLVGDSMHIKELSGQLNGNPIVANGTATGLVHHISNKMHPVQIGLAAKSPRFNINRFMADTKTDLQAKNASASPARLAKETDNLQIDISLSANEVWFKKMVGRQLTGKMQLAQNRLELSSLKFKACGGLFDVKTTINDINQPYKKLDFTAEMNQVDARLLFEGMEEFGQKVCRSRNLAGTLQLKARFSTDLNNQFTAQTSSMKGRFDFELKKGKLIDFEPLMSLSGFILPKETLREVDIANLKHTFYLEGKRLEMEEMEVPTSLATLFVQGFYSFDNLLDMRILVPLQSIHRQHIAKVPAVGMADKTAVSIPIHAYTKDGKTRIELDGERARSRLSKKIKSWF